MPLTLAEEEVDRSELSDPELGFDRVGAFGDGNALRQRGLVKRDGVLALLGNPEVPLAVGIGLGFGAEAVAVDSHRDALERLFLVGDVSDEVVCEGRRIVCCGCRGHAHKGEQSEGCGEEGHHCPCSRPWLGSGELHGTSRSFQTACSCRIGNATVVDHSYRLLLACFVRNTIWSSKYGAEFLSVIVVNID